MTKYDCLLKNSFFLISLKIDVINIHNNILKNSFLASYYHRHDRRIFSKLGTKYEEI